MHFSNVPLDSRYRPVAAADIDRPGTAKREHWPDLPLVLDAPGSLGSPEPLVVSVSIPGSAGVRGTIDVDFDPKVLAFLACTDDAGLVRPGHLRLYVSPGVASAYSAQIQFDPISAAPGVVQVQLVEARLETDNGDPIQPVLPPARSVVISRPN